MKTSVSLTRCPARFKYLALALRSCMGQAGSAPVCFPDNRTGGARDKAGPSSARIPFLVGMTVAGMALGIAPAMATVTCAASGPSPEHPGTTVSGEATFSLSGSTLTQNQKNTGAPTPDQGDTLTGVIFSIAGHPTNALTYNGKANPTLAPGSKSYLDSTTPDSNPPSTKPLFNNTGSSWTDKLTGGLALGNYGVATTGWGGFFNGNIPLGTGGPDYSIVAAGTFPGGSPSSFPFIQNALQFQFTTNASFTESDITGVMFLFGTKGSNGVGPTSCTDFGDAPDKVAGTALGTPTTPPDYQTRLADGGPSHLIDPNRKVFLGQNPPDGDDGTLQNDTATADNTTGIDDEDGVDLKNLPTILTTTKSVTMKVQVANLTDTRALLACWIDFNRNGIFGDTAGELATAPVDAGTSPGTFVPLTFSGFPTPLTPGPTALRCRISTDSTWKAIVAAGGVPGSIGPASDGEVEDYMVNGIYESCNTGPITSLPAQPGLQSGVQFSVTGSAGMGNIASIQCPKMINIDPSTGMTFSAPSTFVGGSPPKWTFTPTAASVTVSARKAGTGTATIMCTASDANGRTCATDPWFASVVTIKSGGGVPNGQLIMADASNDHITVTNRTPGVDKLEITVNGRKFVEDNLKDGEVRSLCVTSAMRNGANNSIYLVGYGKPGGSADLLGEPGRCY